MTENTTNGVSNKFKANFLPNSPFINATVKGDVFFAYVHGLTFSIGDKMIRIQIIDKFGKIWEGLSRFENEENYWAICPETLKIEQEI